MSQRDGFTGGFVAGAIVGSLVGGLIGALIVGQRDTENEEAQQPLLNTNRTEAKAVKGKKRQRLNTEDSIEVARRSLEDKIAQLNSAIDDVRQQLGNVNGTPEPLDQERSLEP